MIHPRRAAAIAAAALALGSLAAPASAATPVALTNHGSAGMGTASVASTVRASSAPPTRSETYAAHIRAQLGLESDLPYIRSLDPQRDLNNTELGTPVTAPELAELNARQALGRHVNAVGDALSALPAFGGVWFKQSGDGAIMVGLTSPPTATVAQAVDNALPPNSTVDFVQVPQSYTQLNTLYQKIIAVPLSADGITNVAIDTADNTVTVGVATQADISAVYAKYGHTGLTVTVAATAVASASRDFTSGPLYGGEWVTFANDEHCTMGYGALLNAAGQLYSMTAGHCAPNGTAAHQGDSTSDPAIGSGMHGGHTFGQPNATTKCDCGFVGVIANNQASFDTLVKNNGLWEFLNTDAVFQGEMSCHSGASSYQANGGNIVCGTVASPSATVSVSGSPAGTFTLTDSIEWSGSLISGDSGAPLGDGRSFLGIASSTNGSDAWFSKATNVQPVTGLTLEY